MSIGTEVGNFYRNIIAPLRVTTTSDGLIEVNTSLSRLDFNASAGIALIFLVQKVALSIFFLAGTIVTFGHHKRMKTSLLKNVKEGLVYAVAIPLGFIGIFFPQTINFLIPSDPYGIPLNTTLSSMANVEF